MNNVTFTSNTVDYGLGTNGSTNGTAAGADIFICTNQDPLCGATVSNCYNSDTANVAGGTLSTTCTVLAVELIGFSVETADTGILLQWETASEMDSIGFRVWRSESLTSPYELVSSQLIPATGNAAMGATYQFTDTEADPGNPHYYQLEEIDTQGESRYRYITYKPASPVEPATGSGVGRPDSPILDILKGI